MTRRTDDDGFVGGAEGALFGVLVFVVGTLLLANAWAVVDAKMAASAAAREAARTFVEADDESTAWLEAQEAAREAMAGYGRRGDGLRFPDGPPELARCARVTVRVEYDVPFIALPLSGGRSVITVTAAHSEIVDPYRSGLGDRTQCE